MKKVLVATLVGICVPFSNYDKNSDCIQLLILQRARKGMEVHIEEEGKCTHCRGMWSSSWMCLET